MSTRTILDAFEQQAKAQPNAQALSVFGDAQTWTWSEWRRDARFMAAALIDSGCNPGDVVAILAGNHPVWPIADIGCLMAGAITAGVYPTSAVVQVHEILNDCGARVVIVDSREQLSKVLAVRTALPNLRLILCADDGSLARWQARGEQVSGLLEDEIDQRIADTAPDDIAVLIYTSGSTGVPKGARISHRYITASTESIATALELTDQDTALSFLPFCHASERIFGHYTRIHAGMAVQLVPNGAQLWQAARSFQPTVFGGLPRFYEKMHEAIAAGTGTIESFIGQRVRVATSGGAMLPREVSAHLAERGLVVLGAYGLTEHLCAVMHTPRDVDFDSAGPPMAGTTLAISPTGEILIKRCALTFSGYLNNAAATRASFTEDGAWLRTGDLGFIDDAGKLHVTGREKDLIALSGGKKVAPTPIERRLAESPWISQAVLFGENRKYISALLVPRVRYVEQWAQAQGVAGSYDALLEHPELLNQIQAEVDAVNTSLSRPEQVKRFALLPFELSPESEELTPTMKVRRAYVEAKYQAQLESLYK
jgi:long-chain acyl-CoA synthetase